MYKKLLKNIILATLIFTCNYTTLCALAVDSKNTNKNDNIQVRADGTLDDSQDDNRVIIEYTNPNTNKICKITTRDIEKYVTVMSEGKQHYSELPPEIQEQLAKTLATNEILKAEAKQKKLDEDKNLQYRLEQAQNEVYKIQFLSDFKNKSVCSFTDREKEYSEMKKLFDENPTINAIMITVDDEQTAKDIRQKVITRPSKIPELVEQSTDIQSKNNGGKISKIPKQFPGEHGKKIINKIKQSRKNKKQSTFVYTYYDKEKESYVLIINAKIEKNKMPDKTDAQVQNALDERIKQKKLTKKIEDIQNKYKLKLNSLQKNNDEKEK